MMDNRNYLREYAAPVVGLVRERLAFFTQPAALPLILLLLAMATVFLLGNDRGSFYRIGHHDWDSSKNLTLAENFSPQHYFLGFMYLGFDKDGNRTYRLEYNRFPKGGYALIKLATLPFGDNFGAKIYAARALMLLLLASAATLAYLSLVRLVGSGWIALTATLLAFSSYYILYYADSISNEGTTDLFAVLLAFHGMVIFAQEGRFRQLLVKSCLALLLGWHVYAFLLPFIILGLAGELFKERTGVPALPSLAGQVKRYGAVLLSSRYVTLGVVTLCFGVAVLAFNIAGEYFASDGDRPLHQLKSVQSAIKRLGGDAWFNAYYAERLVWGNFLESQFYRVGRMLYPFFLSPFDNIYETIDLGLEVNKARDYLAVFTGVLALAVCGIGLVFARVRHKMLLATLAISGFCWALPLRHSVFYHDWEAIFYVGVPLVFFALIMLYLRKLLSQRGIIVVAAAALLLFILSSAEMARIGHDEGEAAVHAEMMQDFRVIRDIVGEGIVVLPPGVHPWSQESDRYGGAGLAVQYFLAGSTITRLNARNLANFAIDRHREPGPALLTPDNRRVFLYDRVLYDRQYEVAALGSPIIASDWNVYLKYSRRLIYTSAECVNTDASFFLHIVPLDVNDLPEHRQQYGFDNLDFPFDNFAVFSDDRCVATQELPEYDIAAIRTGQYTDDGPLWEGEYHFELTPDDRRVFLYDRALYDGQFDAADLGSPIIASDWNVYLKDGRRLIYISEECANTDAWIFLHIDPRDADDLPEHRQQYGFDNLDFRFGDFVVRRGDRCVALRELPGYDITDIRTGQYTDDGPLWAGEYRFER